MENDSWLKDRVTFLKGLKSRTEQQELLVILSEKTNRTPQDEKKLVALAKAEKANVRAAKARQDAAKLINDEKKKKQDEDRKARNHRLILQGVLVDLAGLEGRSQGEILGLLLAGGTTTDQQKWEAWRAKGDALLAEKGTAANGND
jgi:hypothetical protein